MTCPMEINPTNSSITSPLRVITHYSSTDDRKAHSPARQKNFGNFRTECKFSNIKNGADSSSFQTETILSNKLSDCADFEKLLGHLGTSGSTPVTPTSFLNPRNITEDQELFADNFSRTLKKLQAEHEGWGSLSQSNNASALSSIFPVTTMLMNTSPPVKLSVSKATGDPVLVVVSMDSCQRDSYVSLDGITPNPDHTSSSDSVKNPAFSISTSTNPTVFPTSPPTKPSPSTRPLTSSSTSVQPTSALQSQSDVSMRNNSSLPTILTIAAGLKQTCSLQATESGSYVIDERNVSSFKPENGTFLSAIPELLGSEQPTTMVRYTASESVSISGARNNTGLDSTTCSSTASSALHQNGNHRPFGGSFGHLYSAILPVQQSSTHLVNVGASDFRMMGESQALSDVSSHPTSFSSTDVSHTQLLNSGQDLHPLSVLYSGTHPLAQSIRSGDLLTDPGSFFLPPNVSIGTSNLNFIPPLPTSPNASCSNVYSTCAFSNSSCGFSSTPLYTTSQSKERKRLFEIVSGSCMVPTDDMRCNLSKPSTAAQSNPSARKNKRTITSEPVTVVEFGHPTASVVCADSSTDTTNYRSVSLASDLKRQSGNIELDSKSSEASAEAYIIGNDSLIYRPRVAIRIKEEQTDGLDSGSNQSEPFSTDTSMTLQPGGNADMMDTKLERKRARNRVAARRCRERKLSLIRTLECQVAERDALVKELEETLARYRSEGERLRAHVEMLADSYPSLKSELRQFNYLFRVASSSGELSKPTRSSDFVSNTDTMATSEHFSHTH